MAGIRVNLEMLAGQMYANAEKLGEWVNKADFLAQTISECGDDTQECVILAEELSRKISAAYDTALDLAVRMSTLIRHRLAARQHNEDGDPAA